MNQKVCCIPYSKVLDKIEAEEWQLKNDLTARIGSESTRMHRKARNKSDRYLVSGEFSDLRSPPKTENSKFIVRLFADR